MHKAGLRVTAATICCMLLCGGSAGADEWQVVKSTHFVVFFQKAPERFVQELLDQAERYYDRIADNMGLRRYNFWLWDNRALLYIHDDSSAYQRATGQPAWSGGFAIPRQKTVHTFPYARGFFETTLPHELGHIIFREFVGFDNRSIPFWLDEGVASYQEADYSAGQSLVRDAFRRGVFINLQMLGSINPKLLADTRSVHLFYAEAVSVVDFLVKRYGKESFVLFCQNLRDKQSFDRALAATYPLENTAALDEEWQRHMKKL